ncbi:MAG: hypothetical protein EKK41_20210 [Hyphomicrobiales bacterium]|nr:MAG: hypothetical protein EKK41_20210 [Hyphomicrobiales bacterium]
MSDADDKLAHVLPPMPTAAETAAWEAMTREEQLATLRAELDHPDCQRKTALTLDEIRDRGRLAAEQLRKRRG